WRSTGHPMSRGPPGSPRLPTWHPPLTAIPTTSPLDVLTLARLGRLFLAEPYCLAGLLHLDGVVVAHMGFARVEEHGQDGHCANDCCDGNTHGSDVHEPRGQRADDGSGRQGEKPPDATPAPGAPRHRS